MTKLFKSPVNDGLTRPTPTPTPPSHTQRASNGLLSIRVQTTSMENDST